MRVRRSLKFTSGPTVGRVTRPRPLVMAAAQRNRMKKMGFVNTADFKD